MLEDTDLMSLGSERDRLDDVRIAEARPLISPAILLEEISRSEYGSRTVLEARRTLCDIAFKKEDRRLAAIIGPCSIHDPKAAHEYASRLKKLADRYRSELFVVMRTYFEKPRTVVGWEGFISDPDLDDSHHINKGLREARSLLRDLAEMGLPAATEFLDMTVPQYISDFIAWGAIGARTTESQPHRKLASGLSMPVGFKNPVDGRIQPAIDAILSSRRSHWFPGITKDGVAAHFRTRGNEHTHVVLRGGSKTGPNYDSTHVEEACRSLREAKLPERVMIDCSHSNSNKDHGRQRIALESVAQQVRWGSPHIIGVMIESNLTSGRQDVVTGQDLIYGKSITDACINFDETERLLETLAEASANRAE
jgi:3-deoxy-7-phosphoheptulonate synthase